MPQSKHNHFPMQPRGFSLVELLIIVLLVGVFTAALPYWLSSKEATRALMLQSIQSALKSSNTVINSQAVAHQIEGDADCFSILNCINRRAPVMLQGKAVRVGYGYAYNAHVLLRTLETESIKNLRVVGNRIEHKKALRGINCSISYTGAHIREDFLIAPSYTLDLTDCS